MIDDRLNLFIRKFMTTKVAYKCSYFLPHFRSEILMGNI